MGILDDAIRQHLDLKRLHGAEDDEVQRLEDEAFGPPTRPGEPDFPESQEQPQVEGSSEPATGEAPSAAAPATGEEATALLDREPAKEPAGEEAPEPAGEKTPEPAATAPAEPAAPAPDPEATEPEGETAFFDQDLQQDLNLDDLGPADEPAEEPVSEEMPAEPVSEEMPLSPRPRRCPLSPRPRSPSPPRRSCH